MTARETWAVIYTMVIDEVYREFSADRLALSVARGMGADVEMPTWSDTLNDFNVRLAAKPDPIDTERENDLMALGLR